jgi:hypothetical protein
MKRRKFAQSMLTALGMSSLPIGLTIAKNAKSEIHVLCDSKQKLTTDDGLQLSLNKHESATKNKDAKQFILTYDVNQGVAVDEKIYQVKLDNGEYHQVFMTPVNDNQLQAVFNHRLNA